MTDDITRARARRLARSLPPPDEHPTLEATTEGEVELDLPGFDVTIHWSPDEAEAFAHALYKMAKQARWNLRKGPKP